MARTTTWKLLAAGTLLLGLGLVGGRMLTPQEPETAASSSSGDRQVLYYRNPMGLPDVSAVPKKDPMGMDYIPVYAGEGPTGPSSQGSVALSAERIQTLGVLTEEAKLMPWVRTVRAVGRFEPAEPALSTVTTKFEGWIERLYVNAVGQQVRAGEPLMAIYSPELVSSQQEYLVALDARRRLDGARAEALVGADALVQAARERLRNWDISVEAIARLDETGQVQRAVVLHAPADGVVLQRTAITGMRVMAGERLLEIADLSRLWLVVDVFEQDLGAVAQSAEASFETTAEPGRTRTGTVDFIYPVVDESTRTTRVRIVVENPEGTLRPGMYATVTLSDVAPDPVLGVSDLAVLDTGERRLVLVALGEGRFESRDVTTGRRADGRVEILAGLDPGEQVVTRANFLIDAESNLRAASAGLSPHAGHDAQEPTDNAAGDDSAPQDHSGHREH
ncbi:MAG: efflux RND transporter periplasmic adaptor subunit [Lysobacterales bacterium]|nr:MAG: efflux RND transporter periplasmic adaptor subunit [Xanthomonadales bacterium]